MANVTKHELAQRAWFKAEIGRRLEALGAEKRGEEKCYPYLLQTRIGPIEIAPEDTWVACVWGDLDRAQEAIPNGRLNRCCGKWNHHYADAMFRSREEAQAAVNDFFCELGIFLPAV
jgi:hypothetical protein